MATLPIITPLVRKNNIRSMRLFKRNCSKANKPRALILCHGHRHEKYIELNALLSDNNCLLIDKDEKSEPDLVLDLKCHLPSIADYGPFDTVALVCAPASMIQDGFVQGLGMLLKPDGLILHSSGEEYQNLHISSYRQHLPSARIKIADWTFVDPQ